MKERRYRIKVSGEHKWRKWVETNRPAASLPGIIAHPKIYAIEWEELSKERRNENGKNNERVER